MPGRRTSTPEELEAARTRVTDHVARDPELPDGDARAQFEPLRR